MFKKLIMLLGFLSCPALVRGWTAGESDIETSYFSSTSSYSLSKDSAGNVWIVKSSYGSKTPVLYALLDCDVNTIEDLVGDYWVSWKLIDGTKDIYPVLHKE